MSKTRDPMRRHFCLTLWRWRGQSIQVKEGHLDLRPIISDIIETARVCRAHYIAWSLEDARLKPTPDAPALNESTLPSNSDLPAVGPNPTGEDPIATTAGMPGARIEGGLASSSQLRGKSDSAATPQGLHIHVYIEVERSIRWSTVCRKFGSDFDGVHVEPRRGWRTTAREYASGVVHGVDKPDLITSGEWGDWRPDCGDSTPDSAVLAAGMILAGQSPLSVAKALPVWFIRNGLGIIRLWETINRKEWRGHR